MGRLRKYCSAQPYLDYIGVSERERKGWRLKMKEERRIKMEKINEKLLMEIVNDINLACSKNGLFGGADVLSKWLRKLGLKIPFLPHEIEYKIEKESQNES